VPPRQIHERTCSAIVGRHLGKPSPALLPSRGRLQTELIPSSRSGQRRPAGLMSGVNSSQQSLRWNSRTIGRRQSGRATNDDACRVGAALFQATHTVVVVLRTHCGQHQWLRLGRRLFGRRMIDNADVRIQPPLETVAVSQRTHRGRQATGDNCRPSYAAGPSHGPESTAGSGSV